MHGDRRNEYRVARRTLRQGHEGGLAGDDASLWRDDASRQADLAPSSGGIVILERRSRGKLGRDAFTIVSSGALWWLRGEVVGSRGTAHGSPHPKVETPIRCRVDEPRDDGLAG